MGYEILHKFSETYNCSVDCTVKQVTVKLQYIMEINMFQCEDNDWGLLIWFEPISTISRFFAVILCE